MRSPTVIRRLKFPLLMAALTLCFIEKTDAQREPADSAAVAYSRAESLVRAHRWDQGLEMLQPLLKRYPHNLRALNLAGLAYTGKGDPQQANTYFHRVLQIEPDFAPTLKNLGINEFTLHEIPSSEKHLDLALKQEPEDPVINLYLGEIAFAQHDFKKAAERLARAGAFLSRDVDLKAELAVSLLKTGQSGAGLVLLDQLRAEDLSPAAQFAVGVALAQADQPDRAVLYFTLVRQRYPRSYNTEYNLILCYIGAKRYTDAISLANEMISSGHDTSELEDAVAGAYEQTHDTPRAIASLRRAIELDPEDEDNYLDFANLCIDHRDFANGLKVIGVGLQARPNSYRLIFERGVLYAMEDQFDMAEKDFRLSAQLAPASNFGYVGMGVTYLETGNAAKAIALLRQRLRQNPNDASLLYLLGESLMRNGATLGEPQYAEAESAFEKSVRLNPSLCLPHVALGEIYIDEKRFKDAISQLKQARAIDPKEKSAYWNLAVAYRRLGDTADAKQILNSLKDIYEQEQQWQRNRVKPDKETSAVSSQVGPA